MEIVSRRLIKLAMEDRAKVNIPIMRISHTWTTGSLK